MMLLRDGQDSTLRVLKQLLSKLDPPTARQPLNVDEMNQMKVQTLPTTAVKDVEVQKAPLSEPRESIPLSSGQAQSSLVSRVDKPFGQGRRTTLGHHSDAPAEDVNSESQAQLEDPKEEALRRSSEFPVGNQESSSAEDSNFQVPVQLQRRATRASVDLRAPSPKKTSTLKRRVKKGTATSKLPPIPPSNPGHATHPTLW
jgi:hypothetical protein